MNTQQPAQHRQIAPGDSNVGFTPESRDRDAIAEYEDALKNQQRNPDIYEGLGDAYRHLNEMESARKAYAKELEIAPSNPIAMYNLGSTAIDLGDAAAGVPLLQEMLKVYHDVPVAEFYLGRGLAESGKDAEAAEHLTKSAVGDAKGEVARRSYYELVRVYRKLHKPEEAEKALAAPQQQQQGQVSSAPRMQSSSSGVH